MGVGRYSSHPAAASERYAEIVCTNIAQVRNISSGGDLNSGLFWYLPISPFQSIATNGSTSETISSPATSHQQLHSPAQSPSLTSCRRCHWEQCRLNFPGRCCSSWNYFRWSSSSFRSITVSDIPFASWLLD